MDLNSQHCRKVYLGELGNSGLRVRQRTVADSVVASRGKEESAATRLAGFCMSLRIVSVFRTIDDIRCCR